MLICPLNLKFGSFQRIFFGNIFSNSAGGICTFTGDVDLETGGAELVQTGEALGLLHDLQTDPAHQEVVLDLPDRLRPIQLRHLHLKKN